MAVRKPVTKTHCIAMIYHYRMQLSLIACAVLLVVMAAMMIDQPLIADEVNFARASRNWAQDKAQTPHPPGYVYLIQLGYGILGQNDWVARLPGIASGLLTLLLIPCITRAVYSDKEKTKDVASAAVWIFTLNPLSAQNMILLDIDNTVLTTAMLVAIWAWYRLQTSPTRRRVTVLSIIFFVSLWFKLTTSLMLLVIMMVTYLLRGHFRRCVEMIIIGGVAGILFSAAFALHFELTGFSSEIIFGPARLILGPSQVITAFPQALGIFILWLAPFQIILWGIGLWDFFRRERRNDDLLYLYTVIVTLTYATIIFPSWYYPKYHTPVIPVISILVAAGLVNIPNRLQGSIRKWIVSYAVLAGILQFVLVRDPLRRIYDALYFFGSPNLTHRLAQSLMASTGLLWLVPVTAVFGLFIAIQFKKRARDVLIGIFGVTMISIMLVTTSVQVTASYSTRYLYGQDDDDLRQTIDLIQSKTTAGDYILAPKSVWYYAHAKGEYIENFVCPGCASKPFLDVIRNVEPEAIVWAVQNVNPSSQVINDAAVRTILQECYSRNIRGAFIIYLRDHTKLCPN